MASLPPLGPESWDLAKARHLLNRAGFGVPHTLAVRLSEMTPEGAVDYLLNYESIPFDFPAPDFLVPPMSNKARAEARKAMGDEERREFQQKMQREEREAVQKLRGWWIRRMRVTPRPLEEKMALFWHGHFATSAQKVKASEVNYALNEVFRTQATGNFKRLTTEVGQSRCMLRYLDNDRSTKKQPNENWARELMELFTLGQGHYTEDDIKNSARAFTGWSTDGLTFAFNVTNHDSGPKTFMGRSGAFDGWDILDILFEQPALGTFICGKLYKYFAAEEVDPAVVAVLAENFRAGNYELKPVLRELFLSQAFYTPAVMGTQIKSPAQLVVKLTHDLSLDTVPAPAMAQATATLGQNIFLPPNVKGWEGNRAWINANTLLLRYNLPAVLAGATAKGHNEMMAGGDSMMLAGAGDPEAMAPAMKEGATPAEAGPTPREQIREKLKGLPKEERQAKVKILREGTAAERKALFKSLGLEAPSKFDPLDDMFESLTFSTAAECVGSVAGKLLDTPMSAAQQSTLVAALAVPAPDSPFTPDDLSDDKRRELLHLITSMAEYQLC
jgi:uncharacterized protein (DUF1800 family)